MVLTCPPPLYPMPLPSKQKTKTNKQKNLKQHKVRKDCREEKIWRTSKLPKISQLFISIWRSPINPDVGLFFSVLKSSQKWCRWPSSHVSPPKEDECQLLTDTLTWKLTLINSKPAKSEYPRLLTTHTRWEGLQRCNIRSRRCGERRHFQRLPDKMRDIFLSG